MENDAITGGQLALPFLVGAGLAFGESVAGALIGPELPKNNDVAGAGAAIMLCLTFAAGFIVTAIALVLQRMNGRSLPEGIALRTCASVIAGGVIGAAAWSHLVPGALVLAALVVAPIATAVPWPWDNR
jgi:hypothetical protein